MTRSRILSILAASTLLGCVQGSDGEDTAALSAALELEGGGLAETDEAPAFGEPDDEAALAAAEDPMESDPGVGALRERPDGSAYRVLAVWQAHPEAAAFDWTGTLRIDDGALVVNRLLHFDGGSGAVSRTSVRELQIDPHTMPRVGGALMTVLAGNASSNLVIESGALDHPVTIPVTALERLRLTVGGEAGRALVLAHRVPPAGCAAGFLYGRWEELRPGLGRFGGRVVGHDGELAGHIRGFYGARRDGSQVAFGKYIDTEGRVRGLLRGTYGDGRFSGQWIVRGGDHGVMEGRYGDGRFGGGYHELACIPSGPAIEGEDELP